MKIKIVPVGSLETNCYIISKNDKCIIIDPGDEAIKIIKEIGNLKPVAIIITHNHFDHIGALEEIKNHYQIPTYDINNLEEGEVIIGLFTFEVIYTKGHHDTCITIYFKDDKIMFTGDFLFKDCIGRIDLENSNYEDMVQSIVKIKKYSDDILVYPGHGELTSLGQEKITNYYFNYKF